MAEYFRNDAQKDVLLLIVNIEQALIKKEKIDDSMLVLS
jgi:F0F1-type ATP synthase beta subunit